jgi:hypothetical protein
MDKISVFTRHGEQRVVHRARDEGIWIAIGRAACRPYGRSARVWGWVLDGQETNRSGTVVAVHYRATVVGPRARDGGHPVLGEARAWVRREPAS